MSKSKDSAAKVEAREVETVTFTVEVAGQEVELTTVADILDAPYEVSLAFEQERNLTAFKALIGNQFAKLDALGVTTREIIEKVIPAWQEATGLGEG